MSVSDLKPGVINECQICRSKKIYEILDLGHSGLCDSLLRKDDLNKSGFKSIEQYNAMRLLDHSIKRFFERNIATTILSRLCIQPVWFN